MHPTYGDGSHGIHDPRFVQAIPQGTFGELDDLAAWHESPWPK